MGIQEYLPQKKNVFGLFRSADASQKKLFGMVIIQTQWIQFLFFSWDRSWQTMGHSINLAHCLFLYCPWTKNGFYIFKHFGGKRIPFYNTWTLYHSWISVQAKLCRFVHTGSRLAFTVLSRITEITWPQNLYDLLSSPLQKKYADHCYGHLTKTFQKLIGKGLYLPLLCFPLYREPGWSFFKVFCVLIF